MRTNCAEEVLRQLRHDPNWLNQLSLDEDGTFSLNDVTAQAQLRARAAAAAAAAAAAGAEPPDGDAGAGVNGDADGSGGKSEQEQADVGNSHGAAGEAAVSAAAAPESAPEAAAPDRSANGTAAAIDSADGAGYNGGASVETGSEQAHAGGGHVGNARAQQGGGAAAGATTERGIGDAPCDVSANCGSASAAGGGVVTGNGGDGGNAKVVNGIKDDPAQEQPRVASLTAAANGNGIDHNGSNEEGDKQTATLHSKCLAVAAAQAGVSPAAVQLFDVSAAYAAAATGDGQAADTRVSDGMNNDNDDVVYDDNGTKAAAGIGAQMPPSAEKRADARGNGTTHEARKCKVDSDKNGSMVGQAAQYAAADSAAAGNTAVESTPAPAVGTVQIQIQKKGKKMKASCAANQVRFAEPAGSKGEEASIAATEAAEAEKLAEQSNEDGSVRRAAPGVHSSTFNTINMQSQGQVQAED